MQVDTIARFYHFPPAGIPVTRHFSPQFPLSESITSDFHRRLPSLAPVGFFHMFHELKFQCVQPREVEQFKVGLLASPGYPGYKYTGHPTSTSFFLPSIHISQPERRIFPPHPWLRVKPFELNALCCTYDSTYSLSLLFTTVLVIAHDQFLDVIDFSSSRMEKERRNIFEPLKTSRFMTLLPFNRYFKMDQVTLSIILLHRPCTDDETGILSRHFTPFQS